MLKNVFAGYSFFRGDINIFMQPLLLHFDSALRFEYYLQKHFSSCFQLFSWIILTVEHKSFAYLGWNKENHQSNLSKMFKLSFNIWARREFQPETSRNHYQSFLHEHNKWKLFKPSTYAKNIIFMLQQLLNRAQLSIDAFNNRNTRYNDNCQICHTV